MTWTPSSLWWTPHCYLFYGQSHLPSTKLSSQLKDLVKKTLTVCILSKVLVWGEHTLHHSRMLGFNNPYCPLGSCNTCQTTHTKKKQITKSLTKTIRAGQARNFSGCKRLTSVKDIIKSAQKITGTIGKLRFIAV
jgi:hypothetical protein